MEVDKVANMVAEMEVKVDMVADIVADKVADILANMEVDKVANMELEKVADMMADMSCFNLVRELVTGAV